MFCPVQTGEMVALREEWSGNLSIGKFWKSTAEVERGVWRLVRSLVGQLVRNTWGEDVWVSRFYLLGHVECHVAAYCSVLIGAHAVSCIISLRDTWRLDAGYEEWENNI